MAQAMSQSNTEYMSDMTRIERIIQKVTNITLKELNQNNIGWRNSISPVEFVATELFRDGYPEKMQETTFLEFLHMVAKVGGNPMYDWDDHSSWSEQLFYYKCVALALTNASVVSVPIKMFLAIPLQAYYVYLERAAHGIKLKKQVRDNFSYIKNSCEYTKDYTIKDYISEKMDRLSEAWLPIEPLSDYKRKIETAHLDIGTLLVSSLCLSFPKKTCTVKSSPMKEKLENQAI